MCPVPIWHVAGAAPHVTVCSSHRLTVGVRRCALCRCRLPRGCHLSLDFVCRLCGDLPTRPPVPQIYHGHVRSFFVIFNFI